MMGVIVTLPCGNQFDAPKLRHLAEASRAVFDGMPGLRSKAFTLDADAREAVNVYVWDSKDAAKAFFTAELVQHITKLYGVRPSIRFVEIATLVDNGAPRS